eukprot:TRINITY_DN3477_c0_g2_i7.p2 TRINITY_DN3477_c0_g2~~TRINITY_DN3477_c0_g2_i7.p2  ORF type:complete len:119 (-),score=3.35 TRINITY_DN3477_c0_g2_i7:161-517(-)
MDGEVEILSHKVSQQQLYHPILIRKFKATIEATESKIIKVHLQNFSSQQFIYLIFKYLQQQQFPVIWFPTKQVMAPKSNHPIIKPLEGKKMVNENTQNLQKCCQVMYNIFFVINIQAI